MKRVARLRRWLRGKWFDWRERKFRACWEDCCMCGSPINMHGWGDGHSPVSVWHYHRDNYVGELPK